MSSTPGKAMSPIFSQGNLATITPTSTNPDITDPKFASLYRPAGKAIYFRTVTTDAYQGPNMANYFADTLKVKSVYGLDDSGAYGIGISTAFEQQAEKRGIKVLGHDRLDPKAADYTTGADQDQGARRAIDLLRRRCAGRREAGQAVLRPRAEHDQGGRRRHVWAVDPVGRRFPGGRRLVLHRRQPAHDGGCGLQPWVKRFVAKTGRQPSDYSITAYDAALVVIDAIERVAKSGKPVDRVAMRDAIAATKLKTLQGEVSFDENGDLKQRVVAVFQVKHDPAHPVDDLMHQYKYVGVAPQV